MSYVITVSGRRASDGGDFELRLVVDDSSERAVLEAVEEFDWTDAATRLVRVEAAESTAKPDPSQM